MVLNKYKYSEMKITNHNFVVPLDYQDEGGKKITIFAREVCRADHGDKLLPYLIFFQGGPGYESPRPINNSGWIKRASEEYRILLFDQRGTGLSTPITEESIVGLSDEELASYLTFFRADNIVRDAEYVREVLIKNKKWSVLGQSFGGFCATHYLSFYSNSLEKVFITGGLPPLNAHPDDIYRSTYKNVIKKNNLFFNTFPKARDNVQMIVEYLQNNPVHLPNGDILSAKRFQQLGLQLGFSDGMATLNYLFENAFINSKLSYAFLKNILSLQSFYTNPIFSVLHEACYAQNFATNWSAQRIINEFPEFLSNKGSDILFTGEMIYPWMFDEYQSLQPFKKAADILARKSDWAVLYDRSNLLDNQVPVTAAVYTNDMYVDRVYSKKIAEAISNLNVWETDLMEHNALRSDGKLVLESLFKRIN